ncbi:MAG: ABC transporter ATP-binding protein [Fibrobacterota bacterium]
MNNGYPDAVSVTGLAKKFGDVTAVESVTFNVKSGEFFGLLGPNGAGKTTTINMLTGLARPDKGTILIGGVDCIKKPRAAQSLIGVVPDESNLYPELTGLENLCFCASLYGFQKKERVLRAKRLLNDFGLAQAASRKFAGYSKGMKRKLTIAAGIIHDPAILFLDEPTTGIDVSSARQIRGLLHELHEKETTIFLTTHYIEEAERLCGRIAFIVNGRIIKTESVEDLIRPVKDRHLLRIVCSSGVNGLKDDLKTRFNYDSIKITGEKTLRIEDSRPVPAGPIVRFLEEHDIEVFEAARQRPSLEDVFVEITGIESKAMNKEKAGGRK